MSFRAILKEKLSSILKTAVADYVYEVRYGRIKIKRKGGLGFLTKIASHPSPEEEFLASLDLEGRTIYDIGAYIGLLTIFFAKAAGPTGQIVAFEPNEENGFKIREHIRLNQVHNVNFMNLGIGDTKKKSQTLIVRRNCSATGSMDEKIQSQIVREGDFKRLQIDIDTLDGAISTYRLPKPDFIKMDIEGMEYPALLGMSQTVQNYSPQFHIEIHGADELCKCENIRRITDLFLSWGYSICHIETRQDITTNNHAIAKMGHIFCRRS
jgi:FkbM family methyltransferase